MNFSLNIGLNVGSTLTHSEAAVHAILAIVFPNARITRSHIRRSTFGELTCCVALQCPETTVTNLPARLDYLATLLQQEAIAAKANGHTFLCGPGAANWNGGIFDEEAWLPVVAENNPHADGEAVAIALAGTEHDFRGYTVGFHPDNFANLKGWFERNSDGTGGELLFTIEDGLLTLIDYDGVYSLPLPVLDLLRQSGVNADRSFE